MKTTLNQLTEYFRFLDVLRDSGRTNMFGAGEYLEEEFSLSKQEARMILNKWMESFTEDEVPADRARRYVND